MRKVAGKASFVGIRYRLETMSAACPRRYLLQFGRMARFETILHRHVLYRSFRKIIDDLGDDGFERREPIGDSFDPAILCDAVASPSRKAFRRH